MRNSGEVLLTTTVGKVAGKVFFGIVAGEASAGQLGGLAQREHALGVQGYSLAIASSPRRRSSSSGSGSRMPGTTESGMVRGMLMVGG